jgi:hypothetical protein
MNLTLLHVIQNYSIQSYSYAWKHIALNGHDIYSQHTFILGYKFQQPVSDIISDTTQDFAFALAVYLRESVYSYMKKKSRDNIKKLQLNLNIFKMS